MKNQEIASIRITALKEQAYAAGPSVTRVRVWVTPKIRLSNHVVERTE